MKVFIGIDNGVSGSIGIIKETGEVLWFKTPTKSELSYTKTKQNVTRIEGNLLYDILKPYMGEHVSVLIERPMVNPMYFKSTLSAVRALEATLIVVEMCKFSYSYIDSKEWQKALLPEGLKGPEQLKPASLQIGRRLFPIIEFGKFPDADGILIAEWARRKFGNI